VDLLGDPSTTLDADLVYYFGSDANPTNDTDPVGGAIDTGTPANELSANNLFDNLRITGSTVTYYAVAYRQNEAA
ncbi:hypothetical protein M3M33_17045, partial [Loigolactobacillus coryniformis]|uniref:hypothetical protein n=1 Tax=Loigolactobacillus coryniformis TaxID=1610 RepID=UPI00201AE43D